MTAVIQRVLKGAVSVDGTVVGKCGKGFFILLGVFEEDTQEDARLLAEKISRLRIFEDEAGKMNLSVNDIGGGALVVSNFTLAANYAKGNRPDYLNAAHPTVSEPLYERFVALLSALVSPVETGRFGADMEISMSADGPVTIVMDSALLSKGGRK